MKEQHLICGKTHFQEDKFNILWFSAVMELLMELSCG